MVSSAQIVMLLTWLGFSGLVFILALIARFYETSSGEKTFYRLYVLPQGLFSLAVARYMSLNRWGDDIAADGMSFLAGIAVIGLCIYLYRRMVSGKHSSHL